MATQAEKDLSIPDQLRQIRDWCKAQVHSVAIEYIEPGGSATDDKSAVFPQMILDETLNPALYEIIIVLSGLSIFFTLFNLKNYECRFSN